MSSGAKRIRQAVVKGLKLEGTAAGVRVFGNRTRPIWGDSMPVLLVFTADERVERFQVSPPVDRRTLQLVVEAVDQVEGAPDDALDDRLDDLAEEVERFMHRDPRFGLGHLGPEFEVEGSRLESDVLVTFERDARPAERPLGGKRLTYVVTYLQEAIEGASEDLEPFRGSDIEWRQRDPTHLDVDARDVVDLPGSS